MLNDNAGGNSDTMKTHFRYFKNEIKLFDLQRAVISKSDADLQYDFIWYNFLMIMVSNKTLNSAGYFLIQNIHLDCYVMRNVTVVFIYYSNVHIFGNRYADASTIPHFNHMQNWC